MSKGIRAEQRVARQLADYGYLVASRRHLGGAGDLLCADWRHNRLDPLLVEVKATTLPFSNFPPADREAMRAAAFRHNLEPLLAWVTHLGVFYVPESSWPA